MNTFNRLASIALFCLSVATGAQAQISITQNDMPRSGDTLRYSEASPITTQIDLTQTGANHTWDYSTALTPNRQGLAEYKTAVQINPAYALFFGLNAYGMKVADTAGAGPVTVTNAYDFYSRNAQRFATVGRGFTYQGFPVPSTYTDADEIYQFPLSFTDRDSSTFKVTFSLASIGSLAQQGVRTNTVDGWGNITTPYGTFAALRIRTVVDQTDSLRAPQLPFPIGFTTRTIVYTWLAAGQHYPILQVTAQEDFGIETITDISYRDNYRVIVPPTPVADFYAFNRNPSVGDSVIIFNATTPRASGTSFQWSLTPATGWRFAFGSSAASANPLVAFSAAGSYSVTLAASNTGGTGDTTKLDYFLVGPASVIKPLATIGGGVYPNPASRQAMLSLPKGLWQARLYDPSGKSIRTWKRLEGGGLHPIAVEGLPKGFYTMLIEGKAGRFVQKLAVE